MNESGVCQQWSVLHFLGEQDQWEKFKQLWAQESLKVPGIKSGTEKHLSALWYHTGISRGVTVSSCPLCHPHHKGLSAHPAQLGACRKGRSYICLLLKCHLRMCSSNVRGGISERTRWNSGKQQDLYFLKCSADLSAVSSLLSSLTPIYLVF